MKNYSLIIWDFNGTLLDDVEAALKSVNDMLQKRQKKTICLDEYKEHIDVPIKKFYENFFDLDSEIYEELLPEYQEGYEKYLSECSLTKYVLESLEMAKEKHIPQIVLSSSQQSQLEKLLKEYGIYDFFDAVLGADNLLAGSKIERAEDFIKSNNIDSHKSIVIGDLVHDYEVAQAINAECLLITSGHHDRNRLKTVNARVEDDLKGLIYE